MSNVIQLGNSQRGFTRMDNDLYEALISADLSGRELRVALAIHRLTVGYGQQVSRISASYIAEMANLRRENVSRIISSLMSQGVLYRTGGSQSPIGLSDPKNWKITPKHTDKTTNSKPTLSVKFDTSLVSFPTHNKDSKEIISTNVDVETSVSTQSPTEVEQPISKPAKPEKQDRIPYQAIIDLYNQICVPAGMPKCLSLNDKRKRAIRSCWTTKIGTSQPFQDLEFWEGYFHDAVSSDFLTGKTSTWRADIDFLTRSSSALKVLEGNYDNR